VSKQGSHTHKLKRIKYKSGNSVFFCVLPDCTFKTSIPLSLGKRSLCWRCGNSFIMSEYCLRLAKPHCEACHKPKKLDDIKLDEIIPALTQAMTPLTLAERLSQTIQQAQQIEEDEI